MRNFDISSFIGAQFYVDQIKEAVFLATYKRYDDGTGYNFVIVRDNDEHGGQRVCFEGSFTATEIDFVQKFCVEQDATFHPVQWHELTDEVRHYVLHNLLPLEWHTMTNGEIAARQVTLMYRGEIRMPYDRYDDPEWLAANGFEDEAAEILKERATVEEHTPEMAKALDTVVTEVAKKMGLREI